MKKTSEAAVNRILNGKSHFCGEKEGFWFRDKETGKNGVTDSYCMVMYDNYVLCVSDSDDAPIDVNASTLFNPFNNEFHEWYSDDRTENISVKEIVDQCKEAKKHKNDNDLWYYANKHGITFNIQLMRDVCEALDCKEVGIYYPFPVVEKNYMKPIVVISENGMGLVMQIRQ